MYKNYIRITLRNLTKRKGYTLLNVSGLAIGITCCLLIFQYVSYEKSYDTFQKHSSQIVRFRLDQYKEEAGLHGNLQTVFPVLDLRQKEITRG